MLERTLNGWPDVLVTSIKQTNLICGQGIHGKKVVFQFKRSSANAVCHSIQDIPVKN